MEFMYFIHIIQFICTMYIICTLFVHYLYIICTSFVHYLYIICTLFVHYLYIIYNDQIVLPAFLNNLSCSWSSLLTVTGCLLVLGVFPLLVGPDSPRFQLVTLSELQQLFFYIPYKQNSITIY